MSEIYQERNGAKFNLVDIVQRVACVISNQIFNAYAGKKLCSIFPLKHTLIHEMFGPKNTVFTLKNVNLQSFSIFVMTKRRDLFVALVPDT